MADPLIKSPGDARAHAGKRDRAVTEIDDDKAADQSDEQDEAGERAEGAPDNAGRQRTRAEHTQRPAGASQRDLAIGLPLKIQSGVKIFTVVDQADTAFRNECALETYSYPNIRDLSKAALSIRTRIPPLRIAV